MSELLYEEMSKEITVNTILSYYDCSIYKEGKFQECDLYIFVRINMKDKIAFVLGSLPKDIYFKKAEFCKKGEVDPQHGWVYKHTCYNLEISELDPPPKKDE